MIATPASAPNDLPPRAEASGLAAIKNGQPGDYFLAAGQEGSTYVWKILDGQDLADANECGYHGRVAAIVAVWDGLNPPHSPKADENDLPYGMVSLDKMPQALLQRQWLPCERLRPMFELNRSDEWVELPSESGFYH